MSLLCVLRPTAAGLVAVVAAVGCAGTVLENDSGERPTVLGLSKTGVSVGESIEIIGAGFLHGPDGHTEVTLNGTFTEDSGKSYPASLTVRPHWEDGNRLLWAHFGPYRVPFSATGAELGTFAGKLTATNIYDDGYEISSVAVDVQLQVLPSIIITNLQPTDADCSEPSKVILDNFAYQIEVEALGFEPLNFTYVTYSPHTDNLRVVRQVAAGNVGTFAEENMLFFDPVPADLPFYVGTLVVAALDSSGAEHTIGVNVGVHRPIEYIVYDRVEVAEIEAARPVSGCLAGGSNIGRTVTYSEVETETRSRTVGVTWNEAWLEQHSSTQGGSRTTTNSVGLTVSESDTSGYELGWENGRDIEGGGSVGGSFFGFVEASVAGKYTDISRESGSVYGSHTSGYTVSQDFSVSDTESWARTTTTGYELSLGGSDFWTISSERSTIVDFEGFILPGEYGVFYRQTTRMALPGAVVVYNRCGVPELVGEGNFYDYTWSVDLAVGLDCPPLPESDLPKPECFTAPCKGVQ